MDRTEMNGFSFHLKKKSKLFPDITLSPCKKKKQKKKNQCDANDAVKKSRCRIIKTLEYTDGWTLFKWSFLLMF